MVSILPDSLVTTAGYRGVRADSFVARLIENPDMAVHPWERERRHAIEAALDFLVADHGCRQRGRFIPSGVEVF